MSSRLIAFDLLYDVFKNEAYSNISLDNALKKADKKDRAFISSLVLGVIERKLTIDYLLNPFLKTKPKPKVNIILLMGAYQLCFMDKVPSSAAINESVELAKQTGCSYYSSLINAVLRNLDKTETNINSIEDLSIRYSCPQELINMWNKQYGEDETLGILNSVNGRAPVFAVPNTRFVDADELLYELLDEGMDCEICGELVRINGSVDLHKSRAFTNGLFYIEDKSSFECAKMLSQQKGDTVLDLCAAPGGKSFTIAQYNMDSRVFSFDLYPHRSELIKQGAERLGLENINVNENDALSFNENIPMADKILCDVPCSGFGIIRRKPEIRYKSLDSIKELPEIQLNILNISDSYLKSGGYLMYSTCTLNKKENEKVVKAFLENKDYSLIDEKTTFPSKDGGDGFYFALMKKAD